MDEPLLALLVRSETTDPLPVEGLAGGATASSEEPVMLYQGIEQLGTQTRALLSPDVLTPEQHADRTRGEAMDRPELRLMLAVLEDGIRCYLGTSRRARERGGVTEAEKWLEDRGGAWLFSFENVCAVLDIDATLFRRALQTQRERARQQESRLRKTVRIAGAARRYRIG